MIRIKTLSLSLLLIFILTACAQAATSIPATAPAPTPTTAAFSDPFAYCAAVGTIDKPDASYTGPKMPPQIVQGLKKASGAAVDAPDDIFTNGSTWRCMDAKVYACFVGANLPCDSKANADKTPTQAEIDFCKSSPTSDFIPMAVTGHDTIYAWACKEGAPAIEKQVWQVDPQGYIQDIWYPITGPGGS